MSTTIPNRGYTAHRLTMVVCSAKVRTNRAQDQPLLLPAGPSVPASIRRGVVEPAVS